MQVRAQSDGAVEARKLYVGNLSFKVGSEDLESHFSQFGSIQEAFVVMDREVCIRAAPPYTPGLRNRKPRPQASGVQESWRIGGI